jgi:RND family efflux transporter MFP subunit
LGKTLKLRLAVPESYSAKVKVGQLVTVYPSAGAEPVQGRVSKIAPSVDRVTRTFVVEVEVPNESGNYKPGGFAKASILVGDAERAVTVPSSSIYSLAGIQKIFVIDQGMAREHHVQLGEQNEDWIEISEPQLPVGAQVITSGQRLLSDGLAVAVRPSDSVPVSNRESKGLGNGEKKPQ